MERCEEGPHILIIPKRNLCGISVFADGLEKGKMKKLLVLFILMGAAASVYAGAGISFANSTNGYWDYTGAGAGVGTFSFVQPVQVTNVVGGPTDILLGKEVYVPDLNISNLQNVFGSIYQGIVNTSTAIEIKDGATLVLSGNLAQGAVVTVGTTASFYDTIDFTDIQITYLNPAYNSSAFIGSLQDADTLDFSLTLQRAGSTTTIAQMILSNQSTASGNDSSRSFSGSMAIPEPATLALLALGGLLIRKRK